MKNNNDMITWAQFNNLVPIIFTLVSVTLSVALFWYQIKLEMSEIKGEAKLTNQKLDEIAQSMGTKFLTVDTNTKELYNLANRLTRIESEQETLHRQR